MDYKSTMIFTSCYTDAICLKYYDGKNIEHLVRLGRQGANTHESGDQGAVQVSVSGGRIRLYEVYTGRARLIEDLLERSEFLQRDDYIL